MAFGLSFSWPFGAAVFIRVVPGQHPSKTNQFSNFPFCRFRLIRNVHFLFCRFRLTRNVKNVNGGGEAASPRSAAKLIPIISHEMTMKAIPGTRPSLRARPKGDPAAPARSTLEGSDAQENLIIGGVFGPRGRSPRRLTLNPNAPQGVSRGPPETQAGRGCGKSLVGLSI